MNQDRKNWIAERHRLDGRVDGCYCDTCHPLVFHIVPPNGLDDGSWFFCKQCKVWFSPSRLDQEIKCYECESSVFLVNPQ